MEVRSTDMMEEGRGRPQEPGG
ncbi:MAG: hypothetical protein RLZZ253_1751, partial [Verrucomicrobiota bacterium]